MPIADNVRAVFREKFIIGFVSIACRGWFGIRPMSVLPLRDEGNQDVLTLKINVRTIDGLVDKIPQVLSAALNDSLYDTRAKMVTQTWPEQEKGARGRKLSMTRKRAAGRAVMRVKRSDPVGLSGSVDVDLRGRDRQEFLKWRSNLTVQEWIRGFVHSTAPQFVGKDKRQRIRMALGAYYRILHGLAFREAVGKFDERTLQDLFVQYMRENSLRTFPRRALQALNAEASKRE